MKIKAKNPIDDTDIFWIDNDFSRNNRPGLDFDVKQKKHSFNYILEKGHGVLDAGSHIGDYGIPVAHALRNINRDDITVYCIDPSEDKCQFMADVVKLNNLSNIKILNYGLTDKANSYSICEEGAGRKVNHVNNTGAWQYKPDPNGKQFVSLDEIYANNLIGPIGFFWLDAQWMEINVLKGGIHYLSKYKPLILMEYWPVSSYCEDDISVKSARPGSAKQLSVDPTYIDFFQKHNIIINERQNPMFSDILLRFNNS